VYDMNFYVYAYLIDYTHTPYYIGKGKGGRAWSKHDTIKLPDDMNLVVILENNLTELGAFALERRMIRWYGRKDKGTGILENKSDGGYGSAGTVHSEETRKKRSNSLMGKKGTMTGKKHRASTKIKMSEIRKGKPATSKGKTGYITPQEERDRISAAQKGIPKPKFTCPQCGKAASKARLAQWHFDKCKHKATINKIEELS